MVGEKKQYAINRRKNRRSCGIYKGDVSYIPFTMGYYSFKGRIKVQVVTWMNIKSITLS